MISCTFKDVSERDMDLLFLEEFICSPTFLELFTQKIAIIDLFGAEVVSIEQSKTDPEYGESDMTVIIVKDDVRYGLLIEDKIDADAMPQQAARYYKRGEIGIAHGDYTDFFVFIVAPRRYLENNEEAQHYPYKVQYEECLKFFRNKNSARAKFKQQQIEQAINKQKQGYQAVIDSATTTFWQSYIAYQQLHFNELELIYSTSGRPSGSTWITFRTNYPKIHIIHKTEKGYVDMEFSGMANKIDQLDSLCQGAVGNLFTKALRVQKTNKSAVIRTDVPVLNLHHTFDCQKASVECALKEVTRLRTLLDDLPKEELYNLFGE